MPEYRVTWEVDIEADSPRAAAVEALKMQRNTDSIATVFEVEDEDGKITMHDLECMYDD